jgi:riboflavin synthase alpha subunit
LNAKHTFTTLVAMTCVALGSSVALGNKVPGDVVTGPVTSVSGVQSISIQGHKYGIKVGSPAVSAAANLAPGQVVEVQLDGPASSPSSHVINVVTHTGR